MGRAEAGNIPANETQFLSSMRWIQSHSMQMLELVETWANIKTYSFNTAGLSILAASVREQLIEVGAQVNEIPLPPALSLAANGLEEHFPLGCAIRGRKRPDAPLRVLLNIHIDTVYPPQHS